jgi:multiple antibiotic resistance protein
MELFLSTFLSLFTVLNPLGAVPLFITLTQNKPYNLTLVSFKCSLYVFFILVFFFALGNQLLAFFGLSITAMQLAGGVIMFLSGLAFITSKTKKHKGISKKIELESREQEDIAFAPMAMPMLAGPGSISLLVQYNQTFSGGPYLFTIVASIVAVCCATFLILASSQWLSRILKSSGILALSRIMGFIVMSIGAQYIINAVMFIWNNH